MRSTAHRRSMVLACTRSVHTPCAQHAVQRAQGYCVYAAHTRTAVVAYCVLLRCTAYTLCVHATAHAQCAWVRWYTVPQHYTPSSCAAVVCAVAAAQQRCAEHIPAALQLQGLVHAAQHVPSPLPLPHTACAGEVSAVLRTPLCSAAQRWPAALLPAVLRPFGSAFWHALSCRRTGKESPCNNTRARVGQTVCS